MDTIIFGLILATFGSMFTAKRWLTLGFFFGSLCACLLLFGLHITTPLDLNF
jgi:hypothetical protein